MPGLRLHESQPQELSRSAHHVQQLWPGRAPQQGLSLVRVGQRRCLWRPFSLGRLGVAFSWETAVSLPVQVGQGLTPYAGCQNCRAYNRHTSSEYEGHSSYGDLVAQSSR